MMTIRKPWKALKIQKRYWKVMRASDTAKNPNTHVRPAKETNEDEIYINLSPKKRMEIIIYLVY